MTKLVAFLVVATLLSMILANIWQRLGRRRREAFIESYPYGKFLDQRLAAKRPELSPEQRGQVFDGLSDYFHLCKTAGQRMVAMPSQAVDDAWHEFILFTRQYDQFCRNAFGRFLHHTPAEAMPSPTAASDGIKRAWRVACVRENIDPKKPDRLPRLFAMDALLLIAGGFIYQLDCMAAGHAGSGYCASHIGCGGGCSGDSGGADGDGGSAAAGDAAATERRATCYRPGCYRKNRHGQTGWRHCRRGSSPDVGHNRRAIARTRQPPG